MMCIEIITIGVLRRKNYLIYMQNCYTFNQPICMLVFKFNKESILGSKFRSNTYPGGGTSAKRISKDKFLRGER